MTARTTEEIAGARGTIAVVDWPLEGPRRVVVIAHGYGEHIGRYEHVAEALRERGAAVFGLDHHGHGESEGERALVEDFSDLLADLDLVVDRAAAAHPGVPLVLLGHSLGGLIATRYAQTRGDKLAGLVISAPVIGGNPDIEALLGMDPIPEVPIPPEALSRDPEVGSAYAADPLVYHGPFKRATLEALFGAVRDVASGPPFELPTLWIHGEHDGLAPLPNTREAVAHVRGEDFEEHVYPGAMHEVLNETNKDEVLADVNAFLARITP